MKKKLIILCAIFLAPLVISKPTQPLASEININIPTTDKNWFDYYEDYYSPASTLPALAPPAKGIKSFSSISSYDYKQDSNSLFEQAKKFYSNSFTEVFAPDSQRLLADVISYSNTVTSQITSSTGVPALDSYTPNEYDGLSEEELKWLINNNIISRDPDSISINNDSIKVGNVNPLLEEDSQELVMKSDFLVALHKATLGVIESRPLVYDITAYRKAEKISWYKVRNDSGTIIGYEMVVGDLIDQPVSGPDVHYEDSYDWLVRGEFKVRLEDDTHFVMATYPEDDALFITSPNVTELYIKSLLDNGIINSKNLYDSSYQSKNKLLNTSSLINAFDNYGDMTDTDGYIYPSYAPELNAYEMSSGRSAVHYSPYLTVSNNYLWGSQYKITNSGITFSDQSFFELEDMLTMDALKFIEAILRVTDGDMTDTEAMIVSYKYGANYIESLSGSDKSTVMYLTAKGILDFDNFEEYKKLYQPLTKEFGYSLLYRVANKDARKNFSEIQLTDSDSFWINRGYGSYDLTVKTPNIPALQSYVDSDGDMTMLPNSTGGLETTDKNLLSLFPYTETVSVTIGDSSSARNISYDGNDYPVYSNNSINMDTISGVDLYSNVNYSTNYNVSYATTSEASASDTLNKTVQIEKSFDNPYKYMYNKEPLVTGSMPATREEKASFISSTKLADGVLSIDYVEEVDRYTVVFEVLSPDANSALQLVDSNLEITSDTLTVENTISVVSKVNKNGEHILLIGQDSLSTLDPNLKIVDDRILVNNLTGAKAILLEEENIAIVGNAVIDSEEDALLVEDTNGKLYYNYNIISSLLSNTLIAPIGEGDLYSMGSVHAQEYKDIFSTRGDKLATGIIGQFTYSTSQPMNDTDGSSEEINIIQDFINISQLTTTSNILTKEITKVTDDGLNVTFQVIVEWEFQLPDDEDYIDPNWTQADTNPTLASVNSFYYTRPSDEQKEYQDYWDNNIGISNALANVIYGTNGIQYVSSGYLIPNVTLLFHIDSGDTLGGNSSSSNELRPEVIVPIAGEWFQEVGDELPQLWIDKFVGATNIYNKIISSDSSSPDYYSNFSNDISVDGGTYRIKANAGNIYFPDKSLNLDWFPAWVHIAFNNTQDGIGNTDMTKTMNGSLWRKYASSRTFSYLPRNERQSVGTIFGGDTPDDVAWVLLPSGALYKSMNTGTYENTTSGIIVHTRTEAKNYNSLVGNEFSFDGSKYIVTGFDNHYLEITATESINCTYDKATGKFISDSGEEVFEIGYEALIQRFIGTSASTTYSERKSSVGEFEVMNNKIDTRFYERDTPYLLTDDFGNFVVNTYGVIDNSSENIEASSSSLDKSNLYGVVAIYDTDDSTDIYYETTSYALTLEDMQIIPISNSLNINTLEDSSYENIVIQYHPTVKLSILGWDIKNTGNSDIPYELQYTKSLPASVVGDMMPTSLTRTVVDSMISNSVGAITLEDLPKGAIILAGDVYLYKLEGNTYATTPIAINNRSDLPIITEGYALQEQLTTQVASILNLPLDVSSRMEILSDYIDEVALAPKIDHDRFMYTNTMISHGTDKYIAYTTSGNSEPKLYSNTDFIQSVSYLVNLQDGLLVTPTDLDNKSYELLLTSTSSGTGNASSLAVMPSDYDTAIVTNKLFGIIVADFEPLSNHQYKKETFLLEHEEQFRADIIYWLQVGCAYITAYLSVICVIMFFSLKNHTFRFIVTKIKHPSRGTKGLDIVKILTLGIIDIDQEYDGRRLFVSVTLMLMLFAFIVFLQERGIGL